MTTLILILLIAVIIYGIYDSRKADKEHEADETRFDENYPNHG